MFQAIPLLLATSLVAAETRSSDIVAKAFERAEEYANYADFKSALVNTQSASYPGDTCCKLYDYPNFGGGSKTFCLDDPNKEQMWDMRREGWENKTASYVCGNSVRYNLCDDSTDWLCKYEKAESGAGYGNNSSV